METVLVRKALLLAFLCVTSALCEQVAVSTFKGLNNNEQGPIIGPEFAQDTLNVEVSPGGKSVKKRAGYGVYKDIDEGALHGGFHFFDSTGNDVQVWGSSKSLTGIVADATPTVLISSATLGSTWDCADTQGFAYCVNSSRDVYVRTNGATIAWQTSPLGTMVEATPDRMIVAGVAANPSSLYVSAANSFLANGFTVGGLTTDAFIEPITAPGSKITHIRWGCGKLLWWKDQSFGYTNFEDQYTLENRIISDNIGTFDNTSAIDPGGNVWFRGQDGHIWRYDCSGLTKESIEITPNIQASGRRTSNSWTQTTQSDWNDGSGNPAATISTTVVSGDVTVTTFTVTENSSSSGWTSGTASNVTVWTSSIALTLNNSGNVDNNSFEDKATGSSIPDTYEAGGGSPPIQAGAVPFSAVLGLTCESPVTPQEGSFVLFGSASSSFTVQIVDVSSTVVAEKAFTRGTAVCSWVQTTITAPASHIGKRAKIRIINYQSGFPESLIVSTHTFILGGNITYYYVYDNDPTNAIYGVDNIQAGSSTITSGSFTSQAYDTRAPYSFVYTSATWTVSTSTPAITLQKADATSGPWTDINASTGANVQSNKRYLRYLSSFTINGIEDARTYLQGVQLIAKSSGVYYSAVKNAPNITTWSTFNPTSNLGDGNIFYFIRRATQTFSVLSGTPTSTTQLTPNSLVTVDTGTYFQVIASFTITAATNTAPALNDFTINWFEGSATDQAYMHYFDNSIWSSVAFGLGVSSNTHVFRYDLINEGWNIYNIGTGGMLTQNARLYFGDTSTGGNVFIFGSGTADNASAINAYWRSKSFTSPDPFQEASLLQIDTFAKKDANQTLTASYTLNSSTSPTSYSINLSSTTQSVIQSRKLLPSGKNGYTWDIRYSDNSATGAFEIFGYRIGFNVLPYRPSQ